MKIYQVENLKSPNFIQKIFGKVPSVNGIIEINNLFANYQEDIAKVTEDDVVAIAEKYKINLKRRFNNQRLALFGKYLYYCLTDSVLEDEEMKALQHIKDILFLNEKETYDMIHAETEKLYASHVKDAVSDGRLDGGEKEKLEKLKKNLLISDEIAKKIYETNAEEVLKRFIEGALSDARLSPDEEKEMNEIAKSLGINMTVDQESKETLDRFRLYWKIENGELPTLEPDINIQKSEDLYFKAYVKWLEQRKVTRRINYGGPTARIKIAKGVYYRTGSMGVQRVTEDVWQTIDTGQIYLTNKRLIFMGGRGNKTIRLNKILDIKPYKNGVDIQKETGRSPFLEFTENLDIFSMMLVRLMDEM